MRFFDPDFFINLVVSNEEAVKVALTADKVLSNNAVCLYGKWDGRSYYDLSTYPKTGDHIKMIGVAPKRVKTIGVNHGPSGRRPPQRVP